MNTDSNPTQNPSNQTQTQAQAQTQTHSVDYAPYPKLNLEDITPPPPPPPSATDSCNSVPVPPPQQQPRDHLATTMPAESNPYVSPAPASQPASSSIKNKMDSVKDVLGTWGIKAAEATKKAEDLAGNMWQHLKTSSSLADVAVAKTKVFTEGGYEKVFRQSFETVPEENLLKSFACYLSTTAGPVMGTLYLSTAKLAFCSDNALTYKIGEETQWSYYKVVLPLHQLRAVNTSTSKVNSAEKYIQIISVDNHEFWLWVLYIMTMQ